MIRIFQALLLAGLFFGYSFAQEIPAGADAGNFVPATQKPTNKWDCQANGIIVGTVGGASFAEAAENCKSYGEIAVDKHVDATYKTVCSMGKYMTTKQGTTYYGYKLITTPAVGQVVCGVGIEQQQQPTFQIIPMQTGSMTEFFCPPSDPSNSMFTLKGKDRAGVTVCFLPLNDIDCSQFSGELASSDLDSFSAKIGVYGILEGQTRPSCTKRCTQNSAGVRTCGLCALAGAKSWYRSSINDATGIEKWKPLGGVYTGGACAKGQESKPLNEDQRPKCWTSKTGLVMCEADEAKKCQMINGQKQCETGCGTVNGQFYCQDKTKNPNDILNPFINATKQLLPDVKDTLTNPTTKTADMTKADYKETQIGVETRIDRMTAITTNIDANLDQTNKQLNDQKNLLKEAVDSLKSIDEKTGTGGTGGTGGDGSGTGDETGGECLPTDATCNGAGTAGPASWWTSSYPEGAMGIVNQHKDEFFASEAYSAMKGESLAQGTGAIPVWNMCFDMGFANYGCKELMIPEIVWSFIKAIMLFGAAIYSRQIIIGK